MQERIVEIIVILLEGFRDQHTTETYQNMTGQLVKEGYTEHEINLAFAWVFDHMRKSALASDGQLPLITFSPQGDTDIEKLVISAEAYTYLMQLHSLGLLSENQIDAVIEKSIHHGSMNISIEDMKSITASIIFQGNTSYFWAGKFFHPDMDIVH